MTRLSLAVCLALAALGCADVDPHGFRPEGLSAADTTEVQAALDEWCSVGHCAYLGDGASTLRMVDVMPVGFESSIGLHERSKVDPSVSRISILRGYPVRRIALHELGHHWACPDSDTPGLTMSHWEDEQPGHLTAADIACAR